MEFSTYANNYINMVLGSCAIILFIYLVSHVFVLFKKRTKTTAPYSRNKDNITQSIGNANIQKEVNNYV